MPPKQALDPEEVAIAALAHVAGDAVLLPRFLALTGIDAASIREAAREEAFLVGVLDFLLAHVPSLMEFADASGLSPEAIAAARASLAGRSGNYEVST
jgi:uncharacterized membrane protein YhhN